MVAVTDEGMRALAEEGECGTVLTSLTLSCECFVSLSVPALGLRVKSDKQGMRTSGLQH